MLVASLYYQSKNLHYSSSKTLVLAMDLEGLKTVT